MMTTDTESKMTSGNAGRLKMVSLATLTAQNSILGLSMRYSRTRKGTI